MAEDTEYGSLTDAMLANDELAEAVKRYRAIDEAFREAGAREKKSLSVELNALMEKIVRLRALQERHNPDASTEADPDPRWGKVVPFDYPRYTKAEA